MYEKIFMICCSFSYGISPRLLQEVKHISLLQVPGSCPNGNENLPINEKEGCALFSIVKLFCYCREIIYFVNFGRIIDSKRKKK